MNAETIEREARDALLDLQLDTTVSRVMQNGKNWCVQFSGDYNQFCDSFQNQFDRDNSPAVIRQKIKKHLLEQITQLRNKGGRRTTRKGFDEDQPNVTELFKEAITETTRAIGDAIDRTLGFTGATVQAATDAAETVTARTAEIIQPERPSASAARPKASRKAAAGKSSQRKETGKARQGGTKRKAAAKTKRAASGAKKTGGKKKSSRKR